MHSAVADLAPLHHHVSFSLLSLPFLVFLAVAAVSWHALDFHTALY